MAGLFLDADMTEARKREARRSEPSVSVGDMILHTGQETRALAHSMIDGKTGANWARDDQARTLTHQRLNSHQVRISAEEGEDLAPLCNLIAEQGLDSALVLMYVLSCLSPTLDPHGNCRAWIDTAEAARRCGILSTETRNLKYNARKKVTKVLAYGERATVTGRRTYRDGVKARAEASQVHSCFWAVTDVEYLDADLDQQGLPSTGRRLPIDPLVPPVRVFVTLSSRVEELLTDPEWRQYLVGLRAVAKIPAGKPSGQIARALGFAFMTEARMQIEAAASDIKALMEGREPSAMKARPRRWWLENFGIDVSSKTYTDHPARLLEHWAEALEILARHEEEGGSELIARRGEAANAAASMGTKGENRQGWLDSWLDEPVRFTPGAAIAGQVLSFVRGESLPVGVARLILNAKRGRPAKPKAPRFVKLAPSIPAPVAASRA